MVNLATSAVSCFRFGGLFHLVDLVPTLLHLGTPGDLTVSNEGLDGLDQWNALLGQERSPRKIMIYNIDDNFVPAVLNGPEVQPKFQIALRENNFKLIWGTPKMLHRQLLELIISIYNPLSASDHTGRQRR